MYNAHTYFQREWSIREMNERVNVLEKENHQLSGLFTRERTAYFSSKFLFRPTQINYWCFCTKKKRSGKNLYFVGFLCTDVWMKIDDAYSQEGIFDSRRWQWKAVSSLANSFHLYGFPKYKNIWFNCLNWDVKLYTWHKYIHLCNKYIFIHSHLICIRSQMHM